MNAEIEHASPHGKAPGEKVPGERKKLGAAAARAFADKQANGWKHTGHRSAGRGHGIAGDAASSAAAYVVVGLGLWRELRRQS